MKTGPSAKAHFQAGKGWVLQYWRRVLVACLVLLMALVIGVETSIIVVQTQVNRRIEEQSARALNGFLKNEQAYTSGGGANLTLRNVEFCWSRKICVLTGQLSATAVSLLKSKQVNFDDINSFILNVHHGDVLISPKTMEGMFNESVFNYPGSDLRDLKVDIVQEDGANRIQLTGSLHYLLWIPFRMITRLSINRANNTLTISVDKLTLFGVIPALWLIHLKPFNLDKILTVPTNNHLTLYHNQILVKPFGLFPPPRINGTMSDIRVTTSMIHLGFTGAYGDTSGLPVAAARNYIYLRGGESAFGRLRMVDTQIQVIDANPQNLFRFGLVNYQDYLPASRVQLRENGAVVLTMPDHRALPDMQAGVIHPKLGHFKEADQGGTRHPGLFTRVKNRIKSLFS